MNLVLLVVAVVLFAIAALLGFDVVTGEHILGWISLGLAFFAASFLVPAVVAWRSP